MPSQSTWMKVAVGVAAVILVWCLLNMRKCGHRKSYHSMPIMTSAPMLVPEKFAPYEPEDDGDDDGEEEYADYMPAEEEKNAEQYVDAADVYSHPDFSSELLD